MDLNIPMIETPPTSSDEEDEENDFTKRNFQMNIANKCYELQEKDFKIILQENFNNCFEEFI